MKHTFTVSFTEAQLERNAAALGAYGINPTQPSGILKTDDIELSYFHDGQSIKFTIERKPWIFPAATIESKIRETLEAFK